MHDDFKKSAWHSPSLMILSLPVVTAGGGEGAEGDAGGSFWRS